MASVLACADSADRLLTARRIYPMFAALFAVGVALRIAFLDRQGLWFDEGVGLIFSTCESVDLCLDKMLATTKSERFQFLYPLMLHGWREMFGSSEIALRSLSVLFGVAAMPLVWRTALQEFGAAHAHWALAFMALSAFSLVHAQEARPYTLFLLIGAAQLTLLLAAKRGSGSGRIGFYLVTGFASWAGLFPLLFSVALAVGDLASGAWRWRAVRQWLVWWLPAGLLCVPATAYYLAAAAGTDPSQIGVPKSDSPLLNLIFVGYGHLVGQTYGPPVEEMRGPGRAAALRENWLLLLALALVAALAAAQFARLSYRRRLGASGDATRLLVAVAIAYLAISFVFAVMTHHNWLPRHAAALHPIVALLLPLLARSVAPGGSVWPGRIIISAILLLNAFSIGQHYFNQSHWKDDYRAAAAYLQAHGEPHRPVIVLRGIRELFGYYGYERFAYTSDPPPNRAAALVRAAAQGRSEIVVVVNRETDLWPRGWLEGVLAPEFRLIASERPHYFSIYTFARR